VQFFVELSKRGSNPIYNIFPDTLSCLSKIATDNEQKATVASSSSKTTTCIFNRSAFKETIKFLLGFIAKDKHSEALCEKMLHRFEISDEMCVWRDAAYCLSLLTFNEKVLRRLFDSLRHYGKAIGDDDVWSSFTVILSKVKKSALVKADLKPVMEEWETALLKLRAGSVEDNQVDTKAKAAARRVRALALEEKASVDSSGSGMSGPELETQGQENADDDDDVVVSRNRKPTTSKILADTAANASATSSKGKATAAAKTIKSHSTTAAASSEAVTIAKSGTKATKSSRK
jgi:condensin complex subunit 1